MNKEYTNDLPAQQKQPIEVQPGAVLARGAIIADVLVTIFLIVGMVVDKHSVTVSVLSGVAFFATFGSLVILTLSGTLSAITINGQNNKTTRYMHRLQYSAQMESQRMRVVEHTPLPYTEAVGGLQLTERNSFVSAYAEQDDSARREAVAWLMQLYGANGEPDPKKVLMASDKERPGRVKIAAPSRPAKEYLLERGVIHDLGNGYRLALGRCSTIATAQEYLAQANGVPRSPTHPLPLPSTIESGAQ